MTPNNQKAMARKALLPFLLITIAGMAASCDRNWLDTIPERGLEGELVTLDIPESLIYAPSNMLALSGWLVWSDDGDRPLVCYDLNAKKAFYPYDKGRADNEILNVGQIVRVSENSFGAVDMLKRELRILTFERDSVIEVSKVDISDFSTVNVRGNELVGICGSETARYAVANLSDTLRHLRTFGDYSEYGFTGAGGRDLLQGHVTSWGDRLAWGSHFNVAFQIVNFRTGETIHSETMEMGKYADHSGQRYEMTPETIDGFAALDSDGEHIAALYDGKDLAYYMTNREAPNGNDIIVYDWDGNALARLSAPDKVTSLSLSREDGRLYLCLLRDGNYVFAATKLPLRELTN